MTTRLRCTLFAAIGLVAIATAAPRVARAEGNAVDVARIHFLAGSSYYKQSRYDDALREFEEANRVSHRPALLYNIALCEKQLSRYADAVQSLRDYLRRSPDASDRAAVDEEIASLEPLTRGAAPRPAPAAEPVAVPARSPVAAAPPAPVPRPATTRSTPSMSPRRMATWIVGASGGALVVTAIGTGVGSHDILTGLGDKCSAPGLPCTPADQSTHARGQSLSGASYGLAAIGVAAIGVAVGLYLTEHRAVDRPHVTLVPALAPNGGALVVAGQF